MDKKLEKIFDLKLDASDRDAERHGLIQYDYGQILRIHGLDLPPAVEIQFSYREKGGTTENRVGTTKDGVTEVRIPDAMLKNNGTTQDYAIWVFIYVTDETSGNTVYRIKLYVDSRPAPGEIGEDPEEKRILDEAVEMVNQAADRAEAAERGASDQAAAAEQSKTDAAESAETAKKYLAETEEVKEETVKELTELSESVKTVIADGEESIAEKQTAAEKAITDHTDTEIARQNAATKEVTNTLISQIAKAETADNELKTTVEDAGKKKAELAASIQAADTAKGRVDNSTELAETAKKNLDKSVQDASTQKSELDKTVTHAEELDTSLDEKINDATQLKSNLQTTGEKAVAAINAAGEDNLKQINEAAEKITENIENLTPDDQTVGKNPWSSKQIIDALCPEFTENGNPVTCYPVENYPLDIVVSWKPIQEGSGNPYPAGYGPNLLDISRCTAFENKPYGLHIVIDDDIIKIDGVPNGEVVNEGEYQFAVAYATQTELQGKGYKVTAFAEKGIAYRAWGLRTVDEPFLTIAAQLTPGVNTDIQFRLMVSKSEPTAYYPYENIRPIHGRDNVTIKRCGENVLDITQLSPNGYNLAGKNQLRPNTTYTFQPMQCGGISFAIFAANNINSSQATKQLKLTKRYVNEGKSETFATPADLTGYPYMWIAGGKSGIGGVFPNVQFLLSIGETEQKSYISYQGKNDMISLAQTIYGGQVNGKSGDGLISWNILTLTGTENWIKNENYINTNVLDIKVPWTNSSGYATEGMCTHITYSVNYAGNCIFLDSECKIYLGSEMSQNYRTLQEWTDYLAEQYAAGTPVQIAYKVAEPVSFRAETEQIPALKGINNILTDADTVTVTGREDPVHYIDKKFAELSAAIVASASEAE